MKLWTRKVDNCYNSNWREPQNVLKAQLSYDFEHFYSSLWLLIFRAMEKHRSDWFKSQIFFLKIVAMQPIQLFSPKWRILNRIFNVTLSTFWHLIVIHLAVFQSRTILLNMEKSLDEFIDYVMIGSIYIYGYMILCYWQFNSTKLSKLMDFAIENFRARSAKGELSKNLSV